jgi:hypothetical protein
METNTINNKVEEKDSKTCLDGEMTKENMVPKTPCPKDVLTNEKEKNKELVTPRTKMGYNDVSNTTRKFGFNEYV